MGKYTKKIHVFAISCSTNKKIPTQCQSYYLILFSFGTHCFTLNNNVFYLFQASTCTKHSGNAQSSTEGAKFKLKSKKGKQ